MDGKSLTETRRLRIFHAFGPAPIRWKGQAHEVQRERVIQLD